jgi:RNA polymerase sigma factor (sigma-70 family)
MLGFYRHSPGFHYDPAKGRFRGYLKRATLNAIRKRRRAAAMQAVEQALLDQQEDEADPDWDRHWEEQQMTRAVEEARRRFDPRTFEAFELYALRGVPAEAVASRLEMSPNSVQQAKSRVLRIVRSIVETLSAHEG